MPRKEFPDHFARVHVFRGLTDHGSGEVLHAAGPGVSPAVHDVTTNFRSAGTSGISRDIDSCTVASLVRDPLLLRLTAAAVQIGKLLNRRVVRQHHATRRIA